MKNNLTLFTNMILYKTWKKKEEKQPNEMKCSNSLIDYKKVFNHLQLRKLIRLIPGRHILVQPRIWPYQRTRLGTTDK